MIEFFASARFAFLTARQLESSGMMEPVAQIFGHVINFLFNIVYSVGTVNSLGIAIVLMTIIFRFLVLPLNLKSQKSMIKMRELKPELDKIKAKYGNSKDPEIVKKFQQEQSALLAKHGANPLTGCLPILIQLPLFIGLNMVMRQAAVYIASLRNLYENLAGELLKIPELIGTAAEPGVIWNLAEGKISGLSPIVPPDWTKNLQSFGNWLAERGVNPENMGVEQTLRELAAFDKDVIILGLPEHLARVINRFTPADWEMVYSEIPAQFLSEINFAVENLAQIQTFLGISVVEPSGWAFPGILIPIFTGISMFISSWLMQQRTFDPNADERTVLTQKMMLFVMPFMMAFFTVQMVAAVGVFWTTGQIFQIIQDIILLKKSGTPIRLPFAKQKIEVVEISDKKKKK
ncbi:MAG: YidC/Oxa1 family membrane protein insertase [Defluviitaleaceae bacterium]|nr:YidC/Oxa1 family membrane protein insertase [Defluviitaleaceae bacterium]